MTLAELLEHIGSSFASAADAPVECANLAGKPGAWRFDDRRPIVGVRLGADEVLLETADPPPDGQGRTGIRAGELLDLLRPLVAKYADRAVEACSAEFEIDAETQMRFDYPIGASGWDKATGTHLLVSLPVDDPPSEP